MNDWRELNCELSTEQDPRQFGTQTASDGSVGPMCERRFVRKGGGSQPTINNSWGSSLTDRSLALVVVLVVPSPCSDCC